jgi:hypothetical protein
MDADDEDASSEPDDFGEDDWESDEDETPTQKPPKGFKIVDMSETAFTYKLTHA